MSKPPLPDEAVAMLAKANAAVVTTLRRDGQPVSAATWYLYEDGRVLVNMDEGRVRLKHLRNDPRVALTVLDDTDPLTHLSVIGHVADMREDTGLADIDRLSRRYDGRDYQQRDRRRYSAWIEIDVWHGWGFLKDTAQTG